jgi:hypothetical protein
LRACRFFKERWHAVRIGQSEAMLDQSTTDALPVVSGVDANVVENPERPIGDSLLNPLPQCRVSPSAVIGDRRHDVQRCTDAA